MEKGGVFGDERVVEAGGVVGVGGGISALSDATGSSFGVRGGVACTVGEGASMIGGKAGSWVDWDGCSGCTLGSGVTRCNNSAIFNMALGTSLPASRLRAVVDGGSVSRVTMSSAAWRRKSSSFTSGKGISCGKKVTVSVCRSARVFGK